MDPGNCTPGEISDDANAWIIQTFCPAGGVQSVRLDLGEREDTATVSIDIPTTLLGGPGADRLQGGPATDQLSGDDGDDTLAGGGGRRRRRSAGSASTSSSGEAGDDDIRVRDGIQDVVRCGDGSDKVDADTLDEIAADCEAVTRTPRRRRRATSGARDRVAPRVEVGAPARRRIGRSRTVRVFASSTERGYVAASGALRDRRPRAAAERRAPPDRGRGRRRGARREALAHAVARRAARAASQPARQRAADRRGHRRAGNSRQAKPLTIRLLR